MQINSIIDGLKKKRQIFHSEADFQHALAWQIHSFVPEANLRLEYPAEINNNRLYLDIFVKTPDNTFGLELKYKTKIIKAKIDDERFILKNHGAQNLGRYDFLIDIKRLESMISSNFISKGYAVLLTNEHLYWTPRNKNTMDADFNIHNDMRIPARKELKWPPCATKGTTKDRELPITLRNDYNLSWQDYSNIYDEIQKKESKFKILVVEIS